jgi:raffinose/stachyose/melibiose transport system permease protein
MGATLPKNEGMVILRKKSSFPVTKFFIYVLLILWTIASLFPIYWMLTFSLKSNAEIFGGNPVGIPYEFRWSNYSNAFTNAKIGNYFLNSVIVTVITILLTVLIASMAAYALIRMQWKLSKLTMSILMLGLMIPGHAALLPVFIMMRNLRLINTLWSLIFPYTGFSIPMGIMVISGLINTIPREMEEAACIDGCSIYKIFFSIIFPMLRPAIATISIFTFMYAWNELMFAVTFISRDHAKTLTVGIQSMSGQYLTEWGPIGAALVIATLPTLIIYLLLSNQVQRSFVAGAIKG